MIRTLTIATTISMLALTSCGGDDLTPEGISGAETTAPGPDGGSALPVVTIPDGMAPAFGTEECLEVANLMMVTAAAAMGNGTEVEEAIRQLAELEAKVPDEVRDDMRIYAEVIREWYAAWSKWAENPTMAFTDPEVVAASERLGSAEVTAALDNLNTYITATCGG